MARGGRTYRSVEAMARRRLPLAAPNGSAVSAEAGAAAFEEWFWEIPPASIGNDREVEARALVLTELDRTDVAAVLEVVSIDLAHLDQRLELELGRLRGRRSSCLAAYPVLLKRRIRHVVADRTFLEDLSREFGFNEVVASPGGTTSSASSSR